MKRREKNDLLKKIAISIDGALMKGTVPSQEAAELVGFLKEIDANFSIDHSQRQYHKRIADGSLVLDKIVDA